MDEVNIPRRRWNANGKTFLVDQALPAGADRLRLSISPDAADRLDPAMVLTITVLDATGAVVHTATMRGGLLTNEEGESLWPFETSMRVRAGQGMKMTLDTGGKAFFASAVVQALQPGEV